MGIEVIQKTVYSGQIEIKEIIDTIDIVAKMHSQVTKVECYHEGAVITFVNGQRIALDVRHLPADFNSLKHVPMDVLLSEIDRKRRLLEEQIKDLTTCEYKVDGRRCPRKKGHLDAHV